MEPPQGCIRRGGGTPDPPPSGGRPAYAQQLSPRRQMPASMPFVTDSNRPNRFGNLLQPPASEAPRLLLHPWASLTLGMGFGPGLGLGQGRRCPKTLWNSAKEREAGTARDPNSAWEHDSTPLYIVAWHVAWHVATGRVNTGLVWYAADTVSVPLHMYPMASWLSLSVDGDVELMRTKLW